MRGKGVGEWGGRWVSGEGGEWGGDEVSEG